MGGKLTSQSKHKKGPPDTYKNGQKPATKGRGITMEGLSNARGVNMEGLLNARAAMKKTVSAGGGYERANKCKNGYGER